MDRALVKTSKFLSLVLRHAPERIGLELDAEGWARVTDLLRLSNAAGHPLTEEVLRQIVLENDKHRFAMSEDGARIRASQGHSIEIDLALSATEPPEVLYHGTAEASVEFIREHGIERGSRQYVHLSIDIETARRVGQRHGRPAVFEVAAGEMHRSGFRLFLSENGVWLTDYVPKEHLRLL